MSMVFGDKFKSYTKVVELKHTYKNRVLAEN